MLVQIKAIFCAICILKAKAIRVTNLKEKELITLEEGQPFDLTITCTTDENLSHCLWVHENTNSKCTIFPESKKLDPVLT